MSRYKVNIEVNDPSTFFVRPFPIAEEDKPLMDKGMQKLISLGILTKNSTTHASPVMLVARKRNERKDQLLTLGYCILG